MIGSYGKHFLDNSPGITEDEMKHLILDDILPCYRHLLQTELAMLYFRHQTETEVKTPQVKHYKCYVSTNKKVWYNSTEDNSETEQEAGCEAKCEVSFTAQASDNPQPDDDPACRNQ